jgi:hypothetical protein
MSSDNRGSVLANLRKPSLVQPVQQVNAALEEKILGPAPSESSSGASAHPVAAPINTEPAVQTRRPKEPTTPVTFHLPIKLRDRIKKTAQAKGITMLELVTEAIEVHLDKNRPTVEELKRMYDW